MTANEFLPNISKTNCSCHHKTILGHIKMAIYSSYGLTTDPSNRLYQSKLNR